MKASYALAGLSALGYGLIAYVIPRENFEFFISVYALLFVLYGYWAQQLHQGKIAFDASKYLYLSIAIKAMFLLAVPALSDDFLRYIWDGRLLANGLNPYAYLPTEVVSQSYLNESLLESLNSPHFYSVYPPVMQLIAAVGGFLFGNNLLAHLVVFHLIILLFELGIYKVLIRLLPKLGIAPKVLFLYAFNPLIVIELTGNLHTEYAMIFFMVLAIDYLFDKKNHWSALAFGGAVLAKLIPLLLLPLFFSYLRRTDLPWWQGNNFAEKIKSIPVQLWQVWQRSIVYGSIVMATTIIVYLPFLDIDLLLKIQRSTTLYFASFEFNASVYYFLRYVVINEYWWIWEYHDSFRDKEWVEDLLRLDWYAYLRKLLPIVEVFIILSLSFFGKFQANFKLFLIRILVLYSLHFLLAAVVHPWYIAPLVLFSVLTNYRFVIVWSALIALTYSSYQGVKFQENTLFIVIEYVLVFVYLITEIVKNRKFQK
mgnify:CR=1 FL=1